MQQNNKYLLLLALPLTATLAVSACSQASSSPIGNFSNIPANTLITSSPMQTRVIGEYLVTLVAGADVKIISETYGRFGIKSIKELGSGLFQVNLGEDPGPEKMEALRGQNSGIKAIQPNFIYRTNRPAGGAQ